MKDGLFLREAARSVLESYDIVIMEGFIPNSDLLDDRKVVEPTGHDR